MIFLIAPFSVLSATPALAQAEPLSDASARCSALARADFLQVQDAPTQITEAKSFTPAGDTPGYCEVTGYVTPAVGFLIRLPLTNWNGKFMEVGCGGTCGFLWTQQCDRPLRKGYACLASDMGHKGTLGGNDALWADNNLQAEVDFGYRATHVAALAGKAISERYYRQAPTKSYFMGCSTGGREGMVEAQRFPWDFDGIIAGAPAVNWIFNNLQALWATRVMHDGQGKAVLSAAALQVIHRAALARCDEDDGVKDGIIGNPRACRFDPSVLLCKRGEGSDCLTKSQVEAAKQLYAGPATSSGKMLYSGQEVGSELNWIDAYVGDDNHPADTSSTLERFRWMLLNPAPGASWNPKDFDFDRDYKRLGLMEPIYAAINPDLRKFKAAGAKLLVYEGWADPEVLPGGIVDYYETAEKTMGGRATTQDFFRLFMVPGMNHCTLGAGAFAADYLSALEAWVEHDQAPDRLIASHVQVEDIDPNDYDAFNRRLAFPLDPKTIAFSRPVYPYPLRAKYLGHGNPNDAGSFGPIGSALYAE